MDRSKPFADSITNTQCPVCERWFRSPDARNAHLIGTRCLADLIEGYWPDEWITLVGPYPRTPFTSDMG